MADFFTAEKEELPYDSVLVTGKKVKLCSEWEGFAFSRLSFSPFASRQPTSLFIWQKVLCAEEDISVFLLAF